MVLDLSIYQKIRYKEMNSVAKQIFVGVTVTVLGAALVSWLGLSENSSKSRNENRDFPAETHPDSPKEDPFPFPRLLPKLSFPGLFGTTIELAKLNEIWNTNRLLFKSDYNGKTAKIHGFVIGNSIFECSSQSEEAKICMMFYDSPYAQSHYGFYAQSRYGGQLLVFNQKNIKQAEAINRLLFQTQKPLRMTIKGTISTFELPNGSVPSYQGFLEQEYNVEFKIIDWQIIDYELYEEQ